MALATANPRLLFVSAVIRIPLIDSFNTESALRSNRRDIRLDRVVDAFAVVSLLERRHESLALYPADKSVGQVAFEMLAHLCEGLSILYSNNEEEAWVLCVFWSNSPAARDCQ